MGSGKGRSLSKAINLKMGNKHSGKKIFRAQPQQPLPRKKFVRDPRSDTPRF
jgi:hypothetical protein